MVFEIRVHFIIISFDYNYTFIIVISSGFVYSSNFYSIVTLCRNGEVLRHKVSRERGHSALRGAGGDGARSQDARRRPARRARPAAAPRLRAGNTNTHSHTHWATVPIRLQGPTCTVLPHIPIK